MSLSNIAKQRAEFNNSLVEGEISDLTDVARRTRKLMRGDFGHSFEIASKQAIKDIKPVDILKLDKFMWLYEKQF